MLYATGLKPEDMSKAQIGETFCVEHTMIRGLCERRAHCLRKPPNDATCCAFILVLCRHCFLLVGGQPVSVSTRRRSCTGGVLCPVGRHRL